MSSRRQRSIPLGGRYRQVSLYLYSILSMTDDPANEPSRIIAAYSLYHYSEMGDHILWDVSEEISSITWLPGEGLGWPYHATWWSLSILSSEFILDINSALDTGLEHDAAIKWKHFCHYSDVIIGTIASQITSLTIVYSIVYSDADQRKHQSSASLAFVQGIHRGPVNSPHKWPVTRKMFPFDDVIMVTGRLRGVSTGHRWIALTQASDVELWCFLLLCTSGNCLANNGDAGDFDVTVMKKSKQGVIGV